jgi:hypothetical protein
MAVVGCAGKMGILGKSFDYPVIIPLGYTTLGGIYTITGIVGGRPWAPVPPEIGLSGQGPVTGLVKKLLERGHRSTPTKCCGTAVSYDGQVRDKYSFSSPGSYPSPRRSGNGRILSFRFVDLPSRSSWPAEFLENVKQEALVPQSRPNFGVILGALKLGCDRSLFNPFPPSPLLR